jgi:hypothetical protein
MRRRALTLFTGILVLGLMPGPALAAGTVDQSNEGGNKSLCGPGTFAQTVTVGRTGKLTSVDLLLSDTIKAYTKVSIYGLDFTGKPIGLALAGYTAPVTTARWYNVSLSPPGVSFNAGSSFAIVFALTDTGCAVGSSGTYPGGQGLEVKSGSWANVKGDANLDFAFRTYVEAAPNPTAQPVPTPTPKPVVTAAPTKTPIPAATATPTATSSASAATTDPPASPTAPSASATPTALPGPQSGGSGDSGGTPIVLIIVGIVALAAVLGGGIGLGLILAKRQHPAS